MFFFFYIFYGSLKNTEDIIITRFYHTLFYLFSPFFKCVFSLLFAYIYSVFYKHEVLSTWNLTSIWVKLAVDEHNFVPCIFVQQTASNNEFSEVSIFYASDKF